MPDSYGADPLMKSMFWHEASAGPTQGDLQGMSAPFQGSVEQARSLYQNPEVMQRLQEFGLGGFDPNQIRQSPFLPNQFMQHHPLMGGMLNQGMANIAATPEAPMVSGAGSGMSRAMQGMAGGPEMLRQYQVRQLMSPFQAMGMQLPIMAEQRRQELLQSLEQDMNLRRAAEFNKSPADNIHNQIYAPPGVSSYFTQQPGHQQPFMPPSGGMMGGGGAPMMQGPHIPGKIQEHPYDLTQASAYTAATHPERVGAGALSGARASEQTQETVAGMPGAKVATEKSKPGLNRAKADEALGKGQQARGRASTYGQDRSDRYAKQYIDTEKWVTSQLQEIQRAAALEPGSPGHIPPDLAQSQINLLRNHLENAKRTLDGARGVTGASGNYAPPEQSPTDLPVVGGKSNPLIPNQPTNQKQQAAPQQAPPPPTKGGSNPNWKPTYR